MSRDKRIVRAHLESLFLYTRSSFPFPAERLHNLMLIQYRPSTVRLSYQVLRSRLSGIDPETVWAHQLVRVGHFFQEDAMTIGVEA